MNKITLTLSTLIAVVAMGSSPSYANDGITLWKEYPAKYYPKKAKIVRVEDFSTVEACHKAMMYKINSQRNFNNNIRFFCL